MKLIDQIQTAQTNLVRSKARTVLTILAIVIGTFMLTMTTGLTQGIRQYITLQTQAYAQPNAIVVFPKRADRSDANPLQTTKETPLTSADLTAVKAIPNVVGAYPSYTVTPASITYNGTVKNISGLAGVYPGDQVSLSAGSSLEGSDQAGILLPYPNLADFGFSRPQDAIGKQLQLSLVTQPTDPSQSVQTKVEELTIRGVLLNSVASQSPFVSSQLLQQLAVFQSGPSVQFSAIVAEIQPGLSASAVASIKNQIASRGIQAITYADQIGSRQQAIDLVTLLLDGFAGIALLVATIGIINTLLMAVLERTQEIGLLKALGLKRKEIFSLFAYEAISLGFWGGLIGIGLGLAAGPVVNYFIAHRQNGNGFVMVFPPLYMAAIVLGAMAVGFLAGVLPANRASKLDPIEALRRE